MPQWPVRRKEHRGRMTEFSKLLETFENRYPQRDYKI
jgi:hypothetical protein